MVELRSEVKEKQRDQRDLHFTRSPCRRSWLQEEEEEEEASDVPSGRRVNADSSAGLTRRPEPISLLVSLNRL